MGIKTRSRATMLAGAATLSVAGALVGLASPAAAAPFSNGSFEDPAIVGGFEERTTGQSIGAWTVVAGTVDLVRTSWPAADGAQSIDLNGSTPGRICQTFDTEAGRSYELTFAMSRNYFASTGTATVTIDGSTTSVTHDTPGVSETDMKWEPRSRSFTADDTSTTICFGGSAVGGPVGVAIGPAIDHVAIDVVNTAPTVTITTPADGAVYLQGQPVTADYACVDAQGTVTSCVGPVADGSPIDTSTLGAHTFEVVATDSDGLTGSASSDYTVAASAGRCRATGLSALGIALGRANPATAPCVNDTRSTALVNVPLGTQLPWPLTFLNNSIRVTAVSGTTLSTPGVSVAESHVAAAVINLPALGLNIGLGGVHSAASSELRNGCAAAAVTGESRVATLTINGKAIVVADGPVTVPLIVGALHLNQQVISGNQITRRALFLDLPGTALDVVLGETIAEAHCTP